MTHRIHRALGLIVAALLTGLIGLAGTVAAAPLKLDRTHSKVGFTAETLLFDVDGTFDAYDIELVGDPGKPESAKVTVSIDVSSIDTQNQKRDDHLKSADFFDAANHPKISFSSTSVRKKGSDQLIVKGNLSMRGKTKPVTIPFRLRRGKNGAGVDTTTYRGKLTVDRTDFGIGTDSIAAKISLEDEVELKLVVVTFD